MNHVTRKLCLITMCLTTHVIYGQDAKTDEAKEFQSVIKHLDMNGNTLVFMNAKQTQTQISKLLTSTRNAFINHDDWDLRGLAEFSSVVKLAYDALGLNDLTSFGLSCVTTGKDAYRNKMVLRTKANSTGLIWNLFGKKAMPLKSLDLLPKNTCTATATVLDLQVVWKWLDTQSKETTLLARPVQQLMAGMNKTFDMNALLKGYGGEVGVFMALDEDKPLTLPIGRGKTAKIPNLALGIFMKVNDAYVDTLLKGKFQEMGDALVTTETIHGVSVQKNVFKRYSGPFQFTPMIASHGGYLFMTTNGDLMKGLLAVSTGKEKGLTATEEFKKMSAGIEATGNSYHVITPKFATTLLGMLDIAVQTMHGDERDVLQFLLSNRDALKSFWSYGVMSSQANGYHMQVNSSDGSGIGVVLQFAAAPLTVGAAMLAPTISKARVKAQRANSSGNLKQMGLAMLGYSGDYGGDFPKKDGVAGLNKIIETNDLPLCKVYINPRDTKRVKVFDGKAKWLTEKTCSYAYVGGGLRDDDVNSTQMPLIWEKPHGDNWCNVLFIDGHVEGLKGNFKTHVDTVNILAKQGRIAENRVQFYMQKAMRMDAQQGIAVDKLPKETKAILDDLVTKLGAEDFKTRKKAQDDLKKHLPKAYPYLMEKRKAATDPEVKDRLKKLLQL